MQSGILKKPEQSKINMHATHAITTSNVKKTKPTSNNIRGCVRSEVLVEITVFWQVIPCNLADRCRMRHLSASKFMAQKTYCEYASVRFPLNLLPA